MRNEDEAAPLREDFCVSDEDRKLWELLEADRVDEASEEFAKDVMAAILAAPAPRLSIWRRPSVRWAAGVAAAAVVLVMVFSNREQNEPSEASPSVATSELADVIEAIDEEDLLAFELDDLDSVNSDWFGG